MGSEATEFQRINYNAANASWRLLDRKGGVQWQVTLAYFVDGHRKRKSKVFPASKDLRTERKRRNALKEWVAELDAKQDVAEREAAERAESERARIESTALPGANTAVGEYVTHCIDMLEASNGVRPSAISDYRTSAKRIVDGVGDVALKDLTPTMIQTWEARLIKGGKSVNTVLKVSQAAQQRVQPCN